MRAVTYHGAGGNEVIRVEERDNLRAVGNQVLIEPEFIGLNPADIQQREGKYPPPPGAPADIPGLEVAGTVVAIGEAVTQIAVGQRVMGIIAGGGLATQVVVEERHVVAVPEGLSAAEAAAIPEAFITAHDAISSQAGLRPGEVLLVSGASGGVGTAAVQIALRSGARVIGLSRGEQGRAQIEALGAIACHPDDVAREVERTTGGSGVDVVLELVGADSLSNSLPLVARKGRIVVVGVGAGSQISLNLRELMSRRLRLIATVLRARPSEEKGQAVQAFAKEVLPGFASGELKAVVGATFPMDEVAQAFDHMRASGRFGKTLLSVS